MRAATVSYQLPQGDVSCHLRLWQWFCSSASAHCGWASCQVPSFWRAFTSLNDIGQQRKATENCLLIRAKLVDGTDEVVSQRCGHIQVMTFAPRTQEPNGIQLHYIMPLALTAWGPAPDCFVYVVMRTISLCWFQCLTTPICSWALANYLWLCPDKYTKRHWSLNLTQT